MKALSANYFLDPLLQTFPTAYYTCLGHKIFTFQLPGKCGWCKYSLVTIGSHLVIMNAATLGSRTLFTITVNWRAPSLSAPADNDISRSLELFLLQS